MISAQATERGQGSIKPLTILSFTYRETQVLMVFVIAHSSLVGGLGAGEDVGLGIGAGVEAVAAAVF